MNSIYSTDRFACFPTRSMMRLFGWGLTTKAICVFALPFCFTRRIYRWVLSMFCTDFTCQFRSLTGNVYSSSEGNTLYWKFQLILSVKETFILPMVRHVSVIVIRGNLWFLRSFKVSCRFWRSLNSERRFCYWLYTSYVVSVSRMSLNIYRDSSMKKSSFYTNFSMTLSLSLIKVKSN